MAMIHDRIHTSGEGMGAIPAIVVSGLGYGLVTAAVSGFMASLPVHHVETPW
jgi:hypothetical protein